MSRLLVLSLASAIIAVPCFFVIAEEVEVEVLLEGLQNPSGVAVQPKTGHVFVSDSAAQKIIRFNPEKGESEDCITGFPLDEYGPGPKYEIGPLGLAFTADGKYLVVGGGGRPDGEELVYLFEAAQADESLTVDDAAFKLGPIPKSDKTESGEGNFYAVATTENAIYVTCNGDDAKGWVARAPIKDGKPGELAPFIATKEEVEVDAPVGICISPRGEVVVGQMGEISEPGDSLLTFYSAESGRLLLNLPTGLHDIGALAYSPKSPHLLYALDFSWAEPADGGLYRLDAALENGKPAVKSTLMTQLDKPAAMAFSDDGVLYVAVYGAADEEGKLNGKLLRITGKKLDE
ncbi:MAG: hypothetical protein WD030_07735 [Pirellulales bacterium]